MEAIVESVSDEKVEAALKFLRDNASSLARAKAHAKFLEQKRKSLKASAYLEAPGSTITERESVAYNDKAYLQCLNDYEQAIYESERLTVLLLAAELTIKVWQTINANARRGHI